MDGHNTFSNKLIISNVFVNCYEFLCSLVVFYRLLMPVLHEMSKRSIEIEESIEIWADRRVFLCQFVKIIHGFVDFALHHEDHPLSEEPKFLYFRSSDLEKACPVDMVKCRVEISILYFGLGDLDKSSSHRFSMIIVANTFLKCQKGLLLVTIEHLQQSSIILHLAAVCLKLRQLWQVLLAFLDLPQ